MPTVPLVLMCPTPNELAPILAAVEVESRTRLGGAELLQARLDGRPLALVRTGLGRLYAAAATALVIERFRPEALVLCGVAAALDDGAQVGDICVPERIADADDGYRVDGELVPGGFRLYDAAGATLKLRTIATDAQLGACANEAYNASPLRRLSGEPARLFGGSLASGAAFLRCSWTRLHLRESHGACAYEMEAAAVAQTALAFDTPFGTVRAFSDSADDDLANDPFTTMQVHHFLDQHDAAGKTPPPNPSNPNATRSAAFALAFANAGALALATARRWLA
ncbi:MAG TPA: 5'-methylthioadenosine/S-adenosylhomocysteine nucleosidase [Limnochordia bacterium]|nr:5'-methylthioadenosine/S-adenosylhomocysteine nucleosidase [Limnochordia bacterium]